MDTNNSVIIGEGSFGCVVKPSLKCNNNDTISYENKVSKVLSTKHATTEISEYDKIDKIDRKTQFYLGKPTKCKIEDSGSNREILSKCKKKGKEIIDNINEYSLIVMEDGGINLDQYVEIMKTWPKNEESVKKTELFLLETLRLFTGLYVFKIDDIMHHDLKPQNIVFNEANNRLNFIDFGQMRSISETMLKSKESENKSAAKHWSYPWESQFLNKDMFDKVSDLAIENRENYVSRIKTIFKKISLKENSFKENKKLQQYKNLFIFFRYACDRHLSIKENLKDILKYLDDYKKTVVNIQEDYYSDFLDKSLSTFDSYGLGFSLMYWLHTASKFLSPDLTEDLRKLYYDMITPNVMERIFIDEARDKLVRIFNDDGLLTKYHKMIDNHFLVTDTDKEDSVSNESVSPSNSTTQSPPILPEPPSLQLSETPTQSVPGGFRGKKRNSKTKCCRNKKFRCKHKNKTMKRCKK